MKIILLSVGLLICLFALAACGRAGDRVVYQYAETEVLFDDFRVKKTVYTPGKMRLYYEGGDLKDNRLQCYDADFSDLGDEFEAVFRKGVLTVEADFAEEISGLTIYAMDESVIYHLRYLDSSQFAWLAQIFWHDDGWWEAGDAEAYYTAEELKARADRAEASCQETMETFALLEGTWVSEDGMRKYEFSRAEEGNTLLAAELVFDEAEQVWRRWQVSAESAFQTEYYDEMDEGVENLVEITLVNADHSAANMHVIYDRQERVIRGEDTTYRMGPR